MIIKKHTFQSGRVDYIIFDDKNIHINKRGYWNIPISDYRNSKDAFCIYDIIIISFYVDLPGLIYDVERIEMLYDSILNDLLYYNAFDIKVEELFDFNIKVEEDSDEFKKIMNLYNTLI